MSVRRSRKKAPKKKRAASERFFPGVIGAGVAALAAVPAASAASFNVTNLNDNGAGSMRQAIVDANNAAGADVVTFQSGLTGTITLSTGQLYIADSVDIQGPGASVVTVSGNNSSRVFYMYDSAATIDVRIAGLTITQGNATIGAGVVDFDENLVLDSVTITENTASDEGGGLWAGGLNMNLTIMNSTISGNIAGGCGGGIYVEDSGGPMLIDNSVITGNQTSCNGGGIYLYDPDHDVLIRDTTISGNTAAFFGGGLALYSFDAGGLTIERSTISGNNALLGGGLMLYGADQDPWVIENSTISGNDATLGPGGGIFISYAYSPVTLNFVTLAGNTAADAGGGAYLYDFSEGARPVTITNSIAAGNSALTGNDLGGPGTFELSYTLLQSTAGATYDAVAGNLFGVDPQLAALANNGGPTETMRPALTSPVVNAADPAFAPPPPTDQRGESRVYPTLADMGALELVGGTIQFNPTTYNVAENAPGSVTLTVTRDVGPDPASVDFTTNPDTATTGDFTTTSGTLTFAAGDLTETFNVPILDDAIVEGNEQFTATLSNPSADATIGAGNPATVTITDFEPGQFVFDSATYNVNEPGGTVTLTVNRVNGSNGPATVNFTTAPGTATGGSDFTAISGTLSWADGDTAPKTIDVAILDDNALEGNEDFTVSLDTPAGATIGSPAASTVTILDDPAGTAQFSSATASTSEGAGSVTLSVTRTGGTEGALVVNYATGDDTAVAPGDYATTASTITFPAGDATPQSINVPIVDDNVAEGSETFTVSLSGAAIGSPAASTVTILDDPAGTAQFSSATANTNEGAGSVTLSVTRTGGTEGALVVNYATGDGTAVAPGDYATTASTITFPAGDATPQSINIPIVDDNVTEGSETFTVSLSGSATGSPAAATVTISDDPGGTAQFSASTANTAEGAGTVTLTVTRTGGTEGALAVNYATSDGTAVAPGDYTATTGTLTFPTGDTTPQSIVVPIINDTAAEGNEAFTVSLTGAAVGSPASSTVTILDDPSGTAQFSASSASTPEAAGTVALSVTRVGGTEGPLAANYATSDGTAVAPADYTSTSGTITFPAGDATPQSILVPVVDDTTVEGEETFTASLTGTAIGSPATSTVTILDDPAGTAQFSVSTINTTEDGGTVTVTVTRTGGTEGPLVVDYATADGTAVAPADYTAASGTLTFPAGDATPQSFTITIINDNFTEGEEMFNVNLTGAAAGDPSSLSIIIAANSHAQPIPTVSFFGKLLLAMFSAMAGLYALVRSRISGILLAVLILGVAAGPTLSAAPKSVKEAKGSKLRGTLVSVTNDGTTIVLTLTGGVSISLPTKSVNVVDARKPKRQAGTLQQVVQGARVVIKTETDANGAIVKAKIKLTTE